MTTSNIKALTYDDEGARVAEIDELVSDIKMVGDLIMIASTKSDELLPDTIHRAGWFIERSASRIQKLQTGETP